MPHHVIAKRLKEILSDRGLTATELSRLSGVKTSFIYDVLSGKSKNPSVITLSKIANTLNVPLADLSGIAMSSRAATPPEGTPHAYVSIATLRVDAAGKRIKGQVDAQQGVFHRSWVADTLKADPENLRLHRIDGDTMEPTMHHRDTVLVDTSKTNPSPPGMFIVYDGFGLVAKRLELVPGRAEAMVSIKADNPQYEAYERSLGETQIIGRVVWFAREL